jgi:hypothetical protein
MTPEEVIVECRRQLLAMRDRNARRARQDASERALDDLFDRLRENSNHLHYLLDNWHPC